MSEALTCAKERNHYDGGSIALGAVLGWVLGTAVMLSGAVAEQRLARTRACEAAIKAGATAEVLLAVCK